jgi:phenylacetate-CoA ligase
LIGAYRPAGYMTGFPDNPARRGAGTRRDTPRSSASFISAHLGNRLREEIKLRGVDAYQAFGTADLGIVSFETAAREAHR